MEETIIATKYILTREVEVGMWCGVAYLKDGKPRSEILWGTNPHLAVEISGERNEEITFFIHHVFVERYIREILRIPYEQVELFRFFLSRGAFTERPTDIPSTQASHLLDKAGKDIWTSYEHICGPYYADPEYITSQFSAGRLEDISPEITKNLILGRLAYMDNPRDLPVLGIILETHGQFHPQQFYEDLCMRLKTPKSQKAN